MVNIHACLVHEEPDCVADLVANLRHFDPDSQILVYDGSEDRHLIRSGPLIEWDGVLVHPDPSPMSWGRLHGFAFDCFQYALESTDFTSMTIVDSDQLLVRTGYSQALESYLCRHPEIGCLVSSDGGPQPLDTRSSLASLAWRERNLWRPFLRRFSYGEQHWPTWTFWPATVFTREAAADVVSLARDPQLAALLARTRFWATEELVLPTLVALHGRQVTRTPFRDDLVRYGVSWSGQHVRSAMQHPDLFWVHPVPRRLDDPLRAWVRESAGDYRAVSTTDSARARQRPLLQPGDVLRHMASVEGWFSTEEGELLMGAALQALTTFPAPRVMVEVGSYCGRSTVVLGSVARAVDPSAKVVAIDPHRGTVGSTDTLVETLAPTFERFTATIRRAGLTDVVRPIRACSFDVSWHDPIALLMLDGLHDFAAVAVDYSHFERHLQPGSLVAFHDYTPGYQGVVRLVDHLVQCGTLEWVRRTHTLAVTRFVRPIGVASLEAVLNEMDGIEGWLSRDEAAYLGMLVSESVRDAPEAAVVEVGATAGAARCCWRAPHLSRAPVGSTRSTPSTEWSDLRQTRSTMATRRGAGSTQPSVVPVSSNGCGRTEGAALTFSGRVPLRCWWSTDYTTTAAFGRTSTVSRPASWAGGWSPSTTTPTTPPTSHAYSRSSSSPATGNASARWVRSPRSGGPASPPGPHPDPSPSWHRRQRPVRPEHAATHRSNPVCRPFDPSQTMRRISRRLQAAALSILLGPSLSCWAWPSRGPVPCASFSA